MRPYQRTPKEVTRAIRYSGLGVRSAGPVGDFLDKSCLFLLLGGMWFAALGSTGFGFF